jgi:hypothetical protein
MFIVQFKWKKKIKDFNTILLIVRPSDAKKFKDNNMYLFVRHIMATAAVIV